MRRKMQYLGMFAFLALMFVKVSALHIYAHQEFEDDAIEECVFCDLAIENQNAEMLAPFPTEITSRPFFLPDDSPFLKDWGDLFKTEKNLHLFLRPPPTA